MSIVVTELYHYPIKSLPGLSVDSLAFNEQRVINDRRFIIVNTETSKMLTQRGHPQLARIGLSFADEHTLKLANPDGQEVTFNTEQPVSGPTYTVKLWSDIVEVAGVDPAVDELLSDFLGEPVTCATNAEGFVRRRSKEGTNFQLGMADGYPLLLCAEESLADLNDKLVAKDQPAITMARFRPNVIIKGAKAYTEDLWRQFSIGETLFTSGKLCDRCVLINVDPATGTPGKEPFRTLCDYRLIDGKARFGINLTYDGPGTIKKGLPLTATQS